MSNQLYRQSLINRIKNAAHERKQKLEAKYGERLSVRLVLSTFKKFAADDVSQMAAALAYYGFLSIFPLLLGLIAILGMVLASSEGSSTRIVDFASDFLPGSEGLVGSNVESAVRFRASLGLVAIVGLLWSGSAIFAGLNKALNRVWEVERKLPFLKAKLKHLGMAIGVGALFAISLAVAAFSQFAGEQSNLKVAGSSVLSVVIVRLLLQLVALGFTFAMFLAIYKLMPDRRTEFRYLWPGALTGTLLFEAAKSFFVFYVDSFTSFENVYGTIAPIIVLLIWVYFCSLILLLGAVVSAVYERIKCPQQSNSSSVNVAQAG